MHAEPLDILPLWGLFLLALALTGLAMEGGYHMGAWRRARTADEKDAPVGAMVGSILGLFAFLLAFTFGLAASRFDTRRQVVLNEANAIGTTYLRARLLPEAQRVEVVKLLKEYTALRVYTGKSESLEKAIARSEELHGLLWSQAALAAEKDTHAITTGLFIQSLNEMIDLHAKRITVGIRNRIPFSIWLVLFALAMIGIGAVGYQSGLAATRRSPAMIALVLAFASVMFLIADLDRGQEGFLTVSQEALRDVQKSMEAAKP